MPRLSCARITFYSQADELGFFSALKSIKAIRNIKGIKDTLFLSVSIRPSEESLRNLIGIFYRYKIDMTQLSQFKNSTNQDWFYDPKSFWFNKVFSKVSIQTEQGAAANP
jgi:hypothetical protein